MSIIRLTCRLITSQNNILKVNSILVKKNELLFSLPRSITTKSNLPSTIQQYYFIQQLQNCNQQQLLRKYSSQIKMEGQNQKLITHELTKNLTLISTKRVPLALDKKTMKLNERINGPLVIIFSWLLAKKKHLLKYSKIYTDQGFNVLTIELTPWQLLWPTKGSQFVAADVLKFLENNTQYSPLMIHGFSVGGYLWGEMMAIMARDLPRYQPLLNKIYAQIWDSAADITEIAVGFPRAIFPKNKTLQNGLRNYVVYHMKTFHDVATVHYLRSSQLFHFTLLKAPALFLVSNSDPVGSVQSNKTVRDNMESADIKTSWHCWEKTPHVGHYLKCPEEYLSYVYKHMEDANLLERIPVNTRAKL